MRLWLADSRRRYVVARGMGTLLLLLAVGLPVAAGALGWRAQSMTTPSMGRSAPVGSLVITEPVAADRVRVGDMIAFHPPGRSGTTFVHRVAIISHGPQGVLLSTKGHINGSQDSWTIATPDLVGRVAFAIPDGRYGLQMLPFLVLGVFLIWFLTAGLRRSRRAPARLLLASVLVSGVLAWFSRWPASTSSPR